jgi:hypothetical protein
VLCVIGVADAQVRNRVLKRSGERIGDGEAAEGCCDNRGRGGDFAEDRCP